MPPVEPLVASHLHPRLTMSSSGPILPAKADRLQSSMTDRAYKLVATSVRALNASSLLLAYQAELQEQMTTLPATELWEEIYVITDHCLHQCAVQSAGRAMSTMITQERARWLSLSNLSDKQKHDILNEGVDPNRLFGTAVATMQKRCEEKKEGEALQLCFPRKTQATPPIPSPGLHSNCDSAGQQHSL